MSTTPPIDQLVSERKCTEVDAVPYRASYGAIYGPGLSDSGVYLDPPVLAERAVITAYRKGYGVGARTIRDIYEAERAELIRQRAVPKWISVKERLPADGQTVDVYVPFFGRISDVKIFWDKKGRPHRWEGVTHWMPLPSPPNR